MIALNFDNSFVSFGIFMIVLGLFKIFITKIFYKTYLSIRGVILPRTYTEVTFGLSLYKFIYYLLAIMVGIATLNNENWVFDTAKLVMPLKSIPLKFKLYYTFELAFYTVEILTIFFEPFKKDFAQMLTHHFVTIILMLLSFTKDKMKYGLVILLLHDLSDPLLEFCKIEHRLKDEMVANVFFIIFMFEFIFLRLFVYPKYILLTIFKETIKGTFKDKQIYIILVCLSALQLMHIVWTKYIVQVCIKVLKGENARDTREQVKED